MANARDDIQRRWAEDRNDVQIFGAIRDDHKASR